MKKTYWLILTAAAGLLLSCALPLGESYASMRSEAVWQTGLQTSAVTVTCDYLKEGGLTVLLDDLTQARAIHLMLTANRETVSGTLSYTVSPENAVEVQAPESVNATAAGTQVELVLTPGEVAQDTEVTLALCWTAQSGETLEADYLFSVPAQEADPADDQSQQTATVDATMTVMEQFVPGAAMVVTVGHPSDNEQLMLSLAGENFPAGTRYSTEYSQQETVLYDPAQISLQTNGRKQTVVLITLPASVTSEAVTLQANVTGASGQAQLQAQTTPLGGSLELPESYFYALTDGDSFKVALPTNWSGCTLSYTVQRLTQTQQGIAYQTTVSAGSQGLSVVSNTDGITVSLSGTDVQAGTYQLLLVWSYQTYTVAQREVTFHISYPERVTTVTGGNEP